MVALTEKIPIQAPVLDRLAKVDGGDLLGIVQIGEGPGDFEDIRSR